MRKVFKRVGAGAIIVALAITALVIYRLMSGYGPVPSTIREPGTTLDEPRVIDLYFADANGRRLALEAREVMARGIEESIHQSVSELLEGPRKENLSPTLPEGVGIRSVYYKEGTAYVDLTSNISSNHPGGSWAELLTVYSIINTITENFAEVTRVQLLIDGREHETLAGHIDISRPLPGRIQLLAGDW
ncbi:spore germination-like protein [bacterium]|nr:MAG: spore germination-like protein [bacterium]